MYRLVSTPQVTPLHLNTTLSCIDSTSSVRRLQFPGRSGRKDNVIGDEGLDKSSQQERFKPFLKKVNDMRKHARAEIMRLRDIIHSSQG